MSKKSNQNQAKSKSHQTRIKPNPAQAKANPAESKPNPTKIISESRKLESKRNRSRSSRKSAESRKPKASRKVKPASQSQSVRSCWCSRCSSCTESLPASQRQMLKHGELAGRCQRAPAGCQRARPRWPPDSQGGPVDAQQEVT